MASLQGQKVKLEIVMKSFDENLKFMKNESETEIRKVLVSGASAYATSASKHTPPSLGQPVINSIFYADGVQESDPNARGFRGRRPIYDLLEMVKNQDCKFRSLYGQKLREGFYFLVKIFRSHKKTVQKFCRTFSEAKSYAHESFRGLTRAAWGLRFSELSGKTLPPAFRKYISARPELTKMNVLNTVTIDQRAHEVLLGNYAVQSGAGYLASTDVNASIAAVKTMNDRMNVFFKKKFNL